MTRNNLIDQLAERTERSKKEAEEVIDALLSAIAEALATGDRVDLRGFGSFQVSGKKERQGRNPRTGEAMTIAARNVAVFKPAKELAERVNATASTARREDSVAELPHAEPGHGSAKVHGDKIDKP